MAPKFKGNSDDWLDDESAAKRSSGGRAKKPVAARSVGLDASEANSIIVEVFPNQCRVKMDGSGKELLCSYRRAEVVSKSKAQVRERTPVAVGDRVLAKSTSDSTGVIEGICARKNCISRPAPGRDGEKVHHVLAANVDALVIVVSCQDPEFSVGFVDRFLVGAEAEGISTCICVSKIDLLTDLSNKPWDIYRTLGYPVFEVSSKKVEGLSELFQFIEAKTVVFCGQSGVGKTSLLRVLLNSKIGRVNEVNEWTGKGRHTTTSAVLLQGPKDACWIDTPGVREFGLARVSPKTLSNHFPEFKDLSCRQLERCLHLDEEGCQARSLVRYSSYRRILISLMAGEN
jgi:ribosome biogenesis GTPase